MLLYLDHTLILIKKSDINKIIIYVFNLPIIRVRLTKILINNINNGF